MTEGITSRSITSDTGRFAMVPVWVLDALAAHPARCAGAVLLYARLSAEADYGTSGELTITQAHLAARVGVSVDTLARTLTLLRQVGAVTWESSGRAATYTVHRAMPPGCGSSTRTRAGAAPARAPRIPTTPEGARTSQNPPSPPGGTPLIDVFGFDEFWTAYPRKVGKPSAERAYRKHVGHARHAQVMAGLDAWARYWAARNEPEFVPHPSTWLNQHRWEDSPPPLPAGRRAGAVQATVDVGRLVLDALAGPHPALGAGNG